MSYIQCIRLYPRICGTAPIHRGKLVVLLAIVISYVSSVSGMRGYAQTSGVGTYSRNELIDLARKMREKPDDNGNAKSGLLEQHLDPVTILAVRTISGRAELHATSADSFFVVEGNATLVTGGTIANPKGEEEVRGDSVQGGARTELKVGDVVHIPEGTPHQLLMDGAAPFVYVLIKTPVNRK